MSKRTLKPEIKADILKCLEDGKKTTAEIKNTVSGGDRTIDTCLSELKKEGKIARRKQGIYVLPESTVAVPDTPAAVENSRGETENIETINNVLNAYDVVLEDITATLPSELKKKASIEDKVDLIKSLRWVAATIDQLMKRWYLVHRGYDTNTRQAVEDAKHKTVEREKQDLENAPPEDQRTEVGHFHSELKVLWDNLPESEKKSKTV